VLNARVLALSVLTDEDGVDVVVGGLEAGNGAARTEIGKEVECPTKCQVERDVTFTDRSLGEANQSESNGPEKQAQHTARGPLRAT
jgi:hypothetical protein